MANDWFEATSIGGDAAPASGNSEPFHDIDTAVSEKMICCAEHIEDFFESSSPYLGMAFDTQKETK
ncbi:hypothetical protein [Primorskyibacter flagellatus]|uniref:hypothetical protein n=1 Tax=Primorskyibacter flagellatus TaxID=1387277 RepID=UPI001C4DDF4B|nr:hypothetical protein [Primorskyibacter flagellatus]